MTATEKYHAVLEGKLSEAEFVRQMRQAFPQYITQWNGYKDSVSILKSKSMIFEKKESPKKDIEALADNFSINVIERGIDIELEAAGIDSTGTVSKEDYISAKRKAISNLQKDQNHYLNLMSGESSKVDKHDKMKQTKRGALEKDTFNDMKKATLKEDVDPTLDPYEDKKEIVRQVIDLVKREKSVPNSVAVEFIKTHYEDIINLRDDQAILDEFDEFFSVNYEHPSDFMEADANELAVDTMGRPKIDSEPSRFKGRDKSRLRTQSDEEEVEEVMDDATMDAIKNYKPGSMDERPHEYKPGDMFTTDFDYEGMLKAGLKIRINTPIDTMQSIYDSFEDVNYHRENAHLGDVIDAVKDGDKGRALDHLKMFRKEIKNTMSDIFEGAFPVRERDDNYVPRSGAVVNERVGGLQEFISLIEDRAAENDTTEAEEAEEVVYAIGDHYNFGVDILHGPNEAKGKDHDGDGDIDGDDYMAAKDKAIKTATGKAVNEAMTVPGNSEEEEKKNAEELLALAKKVGLDKAEIKYRENGSIFGVELNDTVEDRNAGKTQKVSDLQDKQFQAAKAGRPEDGKSSFKPKKLKKLTVGGKTYEIGDFDPNDDGRIESIEKYPNGYFISGGVYSDYGDGDKPKEGYGYAIDLKGNQMDEEDLEGMYENAATKKATGKDGVIRENLKAIISKVLEEQVINEAATQELARIADDYAGFEGMKGAILDLENIVSDIEAYYDKTRDKIQKVYDTLGEIRNEEGLKVGGFLAPAIEAAFMKDLRPVTKQGFTKGLDQPKVRTISRAEIDAARERGEIDETPLEPKQSVFTPNI